MVKKDGFQDPERHARIMDKLTELVREEDLTGLMVLAMRPEGKSNVLAPFTVTGHNSADGESLRSLCNEVTRLFANITGLAIRQPPK